ncbi:MAG: DUF3987 domain-containing protein [Prevotella sp.]|nr:DUF3987 domain-containing protein [Prevotella sp.]
MTIKDCIQEGQETAHPLKDGEAQYPSLSEIYSSPTPPRLPNKLPKLVRAVTSETPMEYKATVAQAMFPALAIYSQELSFQYIDNQERQLRMNCLTVGGTGDGKDTCLRQPLKHILRDAKERDEENRRKLVEYNAEFNRKSANSEKPERPKDLVIQIIKPNITLAALFQRMDEAQSAPLYCGMNELEQWDKVEGATGRNNQFTMLKLADDEWNDVGADRAGTQSVTASGSLFLNWNANTTPSKALRYFQYVMTDGPISRLVLATVPHMEIGSEMPVFGNYDEKYDEKLRPFIENLKQATGSIVCKKAMQMVRDLKQELDEFLILSQDYVLNNLARRALVHAFRKACLLYAANGMKWEKSIYDFCRWSLHYDLYLKLKFFGDAIRNEDGKLQLSKRGPQSLLAELTTKEKKVFTYKELVALRQQKGMDEKGTNKLLSKWKQRGYIRQLTDDSFERLK